MIGPFFFVASVPCASFYMWLSLWSFLTMRRNIQFKLWTYKVLVCQEEKSVKEKYFITVLMKWYVVKDITISSFEVAALTLSKEVLATTNVQSL